jgi:feruloyl esterase
MPRIGNDLCPTHFHRRVKASRRLLENREGVNPRTKEQIYLGLALGSELGWTSDVGRMHIDITKTQASEYLRYAVFQDGNWDFTTFDFDSGMAMADRIDDSLTKAMDPNLGDFFHRGGKLLQYHGWSDPSISPLNS